MRELVSGFNAEGFEGDVEVLEEGPRSCGFAELHVEVEVIVRRTRHREDGFRVAY